MTTTSKTKILKLQDIAAWWLPDQLPKVLENCEIKAVLPALQRGFVWKPAQIELLWDSILQGFPIGSLLVSKISTDETEKDNVASAHAGCGALTSPTHFLLDGQQRATAIALGFRNIWCENQRKQCKKCGEKFNPTKALWVDMQPPESDDRQFVFRLVTRAHPFTLAA